MILTSYCMSIGKSLLIIKKATAYAQSEKRALIAHANNECPDQHSRSLIRAFVARLLNH